MEAGKEVEVNQKKNLAQWMGHQVNGGHLLNEMITPDTLRKYIP